MRRFLSSISRLIAYFLVMSVLSSGIAMAAYACPQLEPEPEPMKDMLMDGKPCAGMDQERPVHCAEKQSGAQLALEHLAAPPSLAPLTVSFVMPAPQPEIPFILTPERADLPLDLGTGPPYLRTLRLRI